MNGENRVMTREALDIILKLWKSDEPFEYVGKYWTVNRPGPMFDSLKFHLKPLQQPHPPIAVATMSPHSDSVLEAGRRGWSIISANFLQPVWVASHWQQLVAGASAGSIPTPAFAGLAADAPSSKPKRPRKA